MESLLKVIVENGVGVGSFIALILFMFNDKKETNELMKKMSDTLTNISVSLATLTDRVDKIEEKIKEDK